MAILYKRLETNYELLLPCEELLEIAVEKEEVSLSSEFTSCFISYLQASGLLRHKLLLFIRYPVYDVFVNHSGTERQHAIEHYVVTKAYWYITHCS